MLAINPFNLWTKLLTEANDGQRAPSIEGKMNCVKKQVPSLIFRQNQLDREYPISR
jgi:hypothetical protein